MAFALYIPNHIVAHINTANSSLGRWTIYTANREMARNGNSCSCTPPSPSGNREVVQRLVAVVLAGKNGAANAKLGSVLSKRDQHLWIEPSAAHEF